MLDIEFPQKKTLITIDSGAQRLLDQSWTEITGLSLLTLMEQAAMSVTAACLRVIAGLTRKCPGDLPDILVLGGKGNNGGDAWACARQLHAHGYNVSCCEALSSDGGDGDAGKQLKALRKLGITWRDADKLCDDTRPDLVVDGMLGSGFRAARGVPDSVGKICRILDGWRREGTTVVSIDLPSGVDADNGAISTDAVTADYTVTFAACKTGLAAAPGSSHAGHIIIEPLSMTADWIIKTLSGQQLPWLLTSDTIRNWRPERPSDGHKGTFGRVLLIGGGKGMAGAARLAGQAAARSGAGLVYMCVDSDSYAAVLPEFPEGLIKPVDFDNDEFDQLKTLSADKQVIAVGPGLGSPGWLTNYLAWLLKEKPRLILDADALNEISRNPDLHAGYLKSRSQNKLECPVLTPHPGEFARLAPDLAPLLKTDRQTAALRLATRLNCIIVLKGASTVVAMPDGQSFINTSGNDGMAKGGSGDCLTGIIAGIAAQGLTMEKAACAGVFLHGLAGDLAAKRVGRTAMLSTDLLSDLGSAWQMAGWLPEIKTNLSERMESDI